MKPASPSSSTRVSDVTPETVKVKGFRAGSLVAKATEPLKTPTAAASRRTAKVVEAPGARVVELKSDARLKPVGSEIAPSVRLDEPALVTVKVCVVGDPTSVRPKSTEPVPEVSAVDPSNT